MEDLIVGTLLDYLLTLGVAALVGVAVGIVIGSAATAHRVEDGERASYEKGRGDERADYLAQMQARSRSVAFDLGDGVVGVVHPAGRAPEFSMEHLRGLPAGVTA